jgi:hypothetical protein
MRTLITAGALAAAVLGNSGCYVASLYPFYTSEDVVFDAGLLGTWVGDDDDERLTISRATDQADSYAIEVLDIEWIGLGRSGPTVTSAFIGRLFRLGDALFMDAFPAPSATCHTGLGWNALRAGMHFLVRVSRDGDTLRMQVLDPDKVDALVQAPPHAHLLYDGGTSDRPGGPGDANLVLTAPTAEIQAFLRRHLDDILQDEIGVMRRQQANEREVRR